MDSVVRVVFSVAVPKSIRSRLVATEAESILIAFLPLVFVIFVVMSASGEKYMAPIRVDAMVPAKTDAASGLTSNSGRASTAVSLSIPMRGYIKAFIMALAGSMLLIVEAT